MKAIIFALFILSVSISAKVNPSKDGVYVLFSNLTGKALQVSGKHLGRHTLLSTASFWYGSNQAFTVTSGPNDWCAISGDHSGKFLTVPHASTGKVPLVLTLLNETLNDSPTRNASMLWRFELKANGLYALQSKVSGKCLTVARNHGHHVYQSNCTFRPSQLFRVMEITPKPDEVKNNRTYFLLAGSGGFALSVGGASRRDGAGLSGYPYYGHPSQTFRFEAAINDTGAFHLINNQTNLALTVNFDDRAGAQVFQSRLHRHADQKWIVTNFEQGWVIQNKATKLYLQLPSWYDDPATIAPFNRHAHQVFTAVQVK